MVTKEDADAMATFLLRDIEECKGEKGPEYLFDRVKHRFDIVTNPNRAHFILPDGSIILLDEKGYQHEHVVDAFKDDRCISAAFNKFEGSIRRECPRPDTCFMPVKFMLDNGAIRIVYGQSIRSVPFKPGGPVLVGPVLDLEMSSAPTDAQARVIRRIASAVEGLLIDYDVYYEQCCEDLITEGRIMNATPAKVNALVAEIRTICPGPVCRANV